MKRITSFEFGPSFDVTSRKELEGYLHAVWKVYYSYEDGASTSLSLTEDNVTRQGILRFDGNTARARNFIGFLQSEYESIEIYPKIFRGANMEKSVMLKHLFYWFDYCRKWKFPFTDVNLSNLQDIDLPELILNLIANQFHGVVSTNPISLYQDMEEAMLKPKGSINFNRYISNSIANGNFHMLECDHQPMEFDNRLNRTIKYVARLLLAKSSFPETRQKLEDIIFILDEAEDQVCQASFLDHIPISPFYQDYQTTIGLCRMVLEQHIYNHHYEDSKHWSLLLPMEYVFEDFIAGFLERYFSEDWEVKYQKSDMYLTDEKAFQMQHDIFLVSKKDKSIKIIVDTKYKLRGNFKEDKKKGIAQNDLYQMTSYAFRRDCSSVLLLYPNQCDILSEPDIFHISNAHQSQVIKVTAAEIPFWSLFGHQNIDSELYTSLLVLLANLSTSQTPNTYFQLQ
ncbi:restriction endonuclease [Olivibacter sp. SDN3]|uniref:McrC family protein n=1 Tax=Olivibacter sp. SDN3 TaxID=2764720 RepID=UPI001650F2BD|nr:restriction endonuclease [Olivibacter sp. SDN3]QNL48955.1 restriction endonuclease [Olivibacter sp. SDN3]